MSWLALAGIMLAGGVILASVILVRNRPEDMGLLPDGDSIVTEEIPGTVEKEVEAAGEPRWQI